MTKILLLGVFHFNPKSDEYIFNSHIQTQLQKLNESFAKFNPDKICVECAVHTQKDIDSCYNLFKLSDLFNIEKMTSQTLGTIHMYNRIRPIRYREETVQIGFRLGKTLNHGRIYAIDDDTILEDSPRDKMSETYKTLYDKCWQKIEYTGDPNNIIEALRHGNSGEAVYYNHQLYMAINSVNSGGEYEGSIYNANWYMRNLKIFANIQKLCETSERLFVIYGNGHLAILRDLIQSCENMELVDIDEFFAH